MLLTSSRFGSMKVDDQRAIQFPKGILGFPRHKQYVLLQPNEDSYFYWLQATDRPELAFVVTDPSLYVSSYRVPLNAEQRIEFGIEATDQVQVFVIVNNYDNVFTANFQGPLVINVHRRIGHQLVLTDRRFTTRVPLVELEEPVEAVAV